MKKNNYQISKQVFIFPYNGDLKRNQNDLFLSEKICNFTTRTRKQIERKIKWCAYGAQIIAQAADGVTPSLGLGGFPPAPMIPSLTRFNDSIVEKNIKIVPIISKNQDKVIYKKVEIYELDKSILEQLKQGTNIQEIINTLRAGGTLDSDQIMKIALAIAVGYVLYQNRVYGFQSAYNFKGGRLGGAEWGNLNNVGSPNPGYQKTSSRIRLRSSINSESKKSIIQWAYEQIPSLSVEGTDWEISAWSAAKHAHHGPAWGIDPTQYGLTKADLESIADDGIINHILGGGTAPSMAYVQALQRRWKLFAEHKKVKDLGIETVMGKQCHVRKHQKSRLFLAIDTETKESLTGYKLTKGQHERHKEFHVIGQDYENKN